jgi:SPP1 gp7 family putative phage head morphogenesis protein
VSFSTAKHAITQGLVSAPFIDGLAAEVQNALHIADATGRSFIVEKDRHFSHSGRVAAGRYRFRGFRVSAMGMNWFVGADDSVRISFDLTPEDALRYLKEKAFWIAGVEDQEVLDAIRKALERALEEGQTYEEFKKTIDGTLQALGVSGDSPYRLQTVFRTNMFSAYTAAQLAQVSEVSDRFPLWRYVAILDARTRPLHRDLNGLIFPQGEGPIPPIDYNCRCSMQMLHQLEIAREGITQTPADKVNSVLGGETVLRLDQKRDFNRWLSEKKGSMEGSIKSIVESRVT